MISHNEDFMIQCMQEIISRVRLDSTPTLAKCVEFCKRFPQLKDVERSLNVTYGMKFINSGNTSAALWYFLLADDSRRIARIVDDIVYEYLEAKLRSEDITNSRYVITAFYFDSIRVMQNLRAVANIVEKGLHKHDSDADMNGTDNTRMVPVRHIQKLVFVYQYVSLLDGIALIENGMNIILIS
jgi:hypothetical protein